MRLVCHAVTSVNNLHLLSMSKATRITATQLLTERGEILRRTYTDREHFIVENHGLPIAAIMPFAEYQTLMAKRKSALATKR